MKADTRLQSSEVDDPEVAFEAMSRRLAGLTAAVEGFATRQQELHARDYGPDLAKLHQQWDEVARILNVLTRKPGIALTPESMTSQINAAGAQVRTADHRAWGDANRQLGLAIGSLNSVVASAQTAHTQRLWIAGAAAAAMLLGFAFGTIIPTRIAHAVPETWYWPEVNAARVLQRKPWDAGVRLLEVADTRRWRALAEAAQLTQDNAERLAACRKRADRLKKAVDCTIKVPLEKSR